MRVGVMGMGGHMGMLLIEEARAAGHKVGGGTLNPASLLFASAGEHEALTHRALDRRVFASSAIRATAWIIGKPTGPYSIDDVLGIADGRRDG